MIFNNSVVVLSAYVENDQSVLIRPISIFFGWIMNVFFELATLVTEKHSLGISIILLTVAAKVLMMPLGLKAQKSTSKIQEMQPEVDKIKKKFEGQKDAESQRKMSQEIQMLYSKNNVSMFGGCLPLLIQMPIFFALNDIMRRSYMFIGKLGDIYADLADTLLRIPTAVQGNIPGYLRELALPHINLSRIPDGGINLSDPEYLQKVINKFTSAEWDSLLGSVPSDIFSILQPLVERKDYIENFAGIKLLDNAGLLWPGVLIPILSVVFMFLSSWFMTKQQKNADPSAKMTQNIMLYGMPLLIGWSTISFPAGVGMYWVVSNMFQLAQQLILNKFYKPALSGKDKDIVKVIKEKSKK